MKKANVGTLRSNLAELLDCVQEGEEIEIQRHNITIARIVPARGPRKNRTKLGAGRKTVRILGDITEPAIPSSDWDLG